MLIPVINLPTLSSTRFMEVLINTYMHEGFEIFAYTAKLNAVFFCKITYK